MSRHFDSRDTGFDYQGQGYRRPEQQYTAPTSSAPYPPPREAPAPPPGSLPPQGHPYYQAPPHSAPYTHQQPPAVYSGSGGAGGGYYPPHHQQWSEHTHPHLPPHYNDPRQYPDHYGPPPHDYVRRGPPVQPGFSQYHTQLSGPFATGPFPSNYGPRTRRRPKEQARVACSNCKKDHVSCNNSRPCQRCLNANKPDECQDVPPKKRGRPRVRPDPYAATQAAAQTVSSSPQEASANKQATTAWPAADQTNLPPREEKDTSRPSTKDATTSSTTSESRYPPSSWRSHFSTPDSAHTAAGTSAPLSRSTTVAGPRPSPPSFARLDTAKLSPIKPVLAPAGQESRATVPLTTSQIARGKSGPTLLPATSSGLQRERPATTGGAGLPPIPGSPYVPTKAASGSGDYQDVPPPPPVHNPPVPSQLGQQGPSASRGPQLPPLSSLQPDARLSPERRPQADSTPVYDFSPTPRRGLSNRGHHPNRYSWHEQQSQGPLLDRSPSHAGASPVRRRSLDARYSRDQVPPSVAGQRRPSESDHNKDGQRKRQRVTLNEIMRND